MKETPDTLEYFREETVKAGFPGLEPGKAYVDPHPNLRAPLIPVNSCNEWTEGSCLHPADRSGCGRPEAVKKVFLG